MLCKHAALINSIMASNPITELNDRTRVIFRSVVESYLDSGAPVGSRTISKFSGLNLSPASIRNVMQDLEELGLLAAPHISAGRVPTNSGLRLFVDGMMQAAEPSMDEQRAIESQIAGDGPIEAALAAATLVLAGLSACAGLVVVPNREAVLKQFNFLRISARQILAILVGADGSVENRLIPIGDDVSDAMLTEAANYMTARLSGLTLVQALAKLDHEIRAEKAALDAASADLVRKGLMLWTIDAGARPVMIVKGQSNLIDEDAAHDLDRVRQLLDQLESKEEIARLLDSARDAQSTRIFIGAENKLFSLSGSSVIAAPYRDEGGQVVGVVGVIGPTRLNYALIVPMVDFTAKALSRLMK